MAKKVDGQTPSFWDPTILKISIQHQCSVVVCYCCSFISILNCEINTKVSDVLLTQILSEEIEKRDQP